MKWLLIIWLLAGTCITAHAQNFVFVYDAKHHEPIPFAEVSDTAGRLYQTDWDGRLEIAGEQLLRVHALGFVDTSMVSDTVFMMPKKNAIPEVLVIGGEIVPDSIFGNASEERGSSIGIGKSKSHTVQFGLRIEFDKPTALTAVNFYVKRRTKRHTPFRLRLYDITLEGDSIIEFSDLIDSSLIGETECRRCWQRIQLSNPIVVEKDILVAIEFLPDYDYSGDGNDTFELSPVYSDEYRNCMTYEGHSFDGKGLKWRKQCLGMFEFLNGKRLNLALFVEGKVLD